MNVNLDLTELEKKYTSGASLTTEEQQALMASRKAAKVSNKLTSEISGNTEQYSQERAMAQLQFAQNETTVRNYFSQLAEQRDLSSNQSWATYKQKGNYNNVFSQYNQYLKANEDYTTMRRNGNITQTPSLEAFNFKNKVTNTQDNSQLSQYSSYLTDQGTQLGKSKETAYTQYSTAETASSKANDGVRKLDNTLTAAIDKGKGIVANMRWLDNMIAMSTQQNSET